MAYNAIVSRLQNVRKLPDSDFLQIATCMGYQVIVGLTSKENDIVVLFPDDGQLSEQYCYENNLFSHAEENKDPEKKGYFDSKRRVRCQTFRGAKSEAYVADLDSLAFTGVNVADLTEGEMFSQLNGIVICNKYVNAETLKVAKDKAPKTEAGMNKDVLKKLFPEHVDTVQVRHARDEDFLGLVTLSLKCHGTSARSAYIKVPEELKLNVFQELKYTFLESFLKGPKSIFNFFVSEETKEKLCTRPTEVKWKSLYATRRVIKGEVKDTDDDYRTNAHRMIQPFMKKGEIWYYEIVGYEQGVGGRSIMLPASTEKLPKEYRKLFGKQVVYKYGCAPDTFDIYVYRITSRTEDGFTYELPVNVVKARCKEAGIKTVPEFEQHLITDVSQVKALKERIEHLCEDDICDPIDPSHPREGICVRVENQETGKVKIMKEKNFCFKILEGIVKDLGLIDVEEAEAEAEF